MRHPEADLQRQIVGYLSWALAPPAAFTSFPAGGGGRVRGAILKGTGLAAGEPDLEILYDGRCWKIELKVPGGRLSAVQVERHKVLRAAKIPVAVIHSLDELRALLAGPWWPIPIRETKESTRLIRAGFAL